MTQHTRYFSPINKEQCAALARLCSLRQPKNVQALQLYAVDGLDPGAISQIVEIPISNVLRTLKQAQRHLADAHLACGMRP